MFLSIISGASDSAKSLERKEAQQLGKKAFKGIK